jgi:DNA-binding GntR family transcriptional regulator
MSKKRREEEAYDFVREKIETREWLPHEHLREQDVAEQLNMSRTPIRKAFKRLHEERFIHVEPYKGVTILKPQIDSKAFKERLEYIELMLNHYIHKLEVDEIDFDVTEAKELLNQMKPFIREKEATFEKEELFFWKAVLQEEKNNYSRSLILEAIRSSLPDNGPIRKILQQSRQTKMDHFGKLIDYMEEGNYPYARREVRILLNQLNLNVIQGL